jgi:uncharacterized protein YeaO (DUF488 family)
MSTTIRIKRVYEAPEQADGRRILVERLWPRGLRKEEAKIDAWLKEIAPSTELRRWYGHEVTRWPEFKRRYEAELRGNPEGVEQLVALCRRGTTTFVYAARDEAHNSAVVLRDFVNRRLRRTTA